MTNRKPVRAGRPGVAERFVVPRKPGRLPAFHAAQTPGEILDKGQRLAQVDIAGVLQREQAISSQV
jgi:hypothetical protein